MKLDFARVEFVTASAGVRDREVVQGAVAHAIHVDAEPRVGATPALKALDPQRILACLRNGDAGGHGTFDHESSELLRGPAAPIRFGKIRHGDGDGHTRPGHGIFAQVHRADAVVPLPHAAVADVIEFLDRDEVEVVDQIGPVPAERVARAGNVELVVHVSVAIGDPAGGRSGHGLGSGLAGQQRRIVRTRTLSSPVRVTATGDTWKAPGLP